MGMYGVEEEFWVDEYHFEVSFSSDNAIGFCQRDVTVVVYPRPEIDACGPGWIRSTPSCITSSMSGVSSLMKSMGQTCSRYYWRRAMRCLPCCLLGMKRRRRRSHGHGMCYPDIQRLKSSCMRNWRASWVGERRPLRAGRSAVYAHGGPGDDASLWAGLWHHTPRSRC